MSIPAQITIDGPAGSGKSTLGRLLAECLDYLYFDTGVMYRVVTLEALRRGICVDDQVSVEKLVDQIQIDVQPPTKDDGRSYDVLVDEEDVTWDIRQREVDANVSKIASYAEVRRKLTKQQRRIGMRGQIVMVGRDIGTVVLPEADLKIYLEASVEVRAKRRHQEMMERGEASPFETILESMRIRDRIDSTRDIAPLKPAQNAYVVDSSKLTIEQVLEQALTLVSHSCEKI